MKKVAYIRVSTFEQNTVRQLDGMTFDKTFTDKLSGVDKERPALLELIDYIREEDEVWVHSIDRLARSLIDLHSLVKSITDKGATIHFKTEQLTFDGGEQNPHQTLQLSMIGAFAQFEREIIKQRQREGIAKAKAKGAYDKCGRKGLADEVVEEIKTLAASGVSKAAIARQLGLSRAVVYKYL